MLISPDAPIVIVGSGPVGDRLLRELIRRAPDVPLVVYDYEPWDPYDRTNLVGVLTGELAWARLDNLPPIPKESRIIRHRTLVVAIDPGKRIVTDLHGHQQRYCTLVLATGSEVHIPEIPGTHLRGISVFRHKSDVTELLQRCDDHHRIAVLGGGILGLELAGALRGAGAWVCVVQSERLMARQLDAKASSMVLEYVRALGIQIVLDRVKEIQGNQRVSSVRTFGGEVIDCDTAVLATGVRPAVELALEARLRVGRGVTVNDRMQTSDACIYALGECAEHRGRVYGLVAPGFEQASVAAENILGGKARYKGSVTATSLKGFDLPVVSVNRMEVAPSAHTSIVYETADPRTYRKLVIHRGKLLEAIAVGEFLEAWRVQEAASQRRRLWPWQLRRFRATGRLWRPSSMPSVRDWPAHVTVCNCRGITRGILSQAVQAGYGTLESLQEVTGAGTGCGSCKPLLAQCIGNEAPLQPIFGEKTLMGACGLAVFLVLLFSLSPPLAPAESVRGWWRPEVLWLDSLWKQISGYSLLALSLVALTLSLRKRWQPFSFASFASWRVLHGLVGVLTLGLLFVHTGFHLGRSPLNILLMTCFLGLSLFGAIAGGMAVAEGRSLSPTIRNWRARWVWYHTLLFWPLPILLTFHILAFYYF